MFLVLPSGVTTHLPAQEEADTHHSKHASASLDVYDGLEATLFASEPMMLSPANIDVDELGRVWVCEIINYRKHRNKRPEGDRILILEDEDGDGVADSSKVFYQGTDVDSAHGIAVLGSKVVVSCAPNVIVFHDDNGDDRPDRKEILFSKTGTPQHDHSTHSFVFGPDGKYYWNQGNTGKYVHDAAGNPIVDIFGHTVVTDGKPYRQGLVFRCNEDGSHFEVLGQNFRNNFEATVDSFGTVWQSDNDDDGNRGTRINYVMEFGNYGYTDEMTGAGWREPRTGMHEHISWRHWHQNDPGVVPNILHLGNGSPAGITLYEGDLLPPVFQGQMFHCEPGLNVVRAYPVKKDAAGYKGEQVKVVESVRDRWFRPADVAVAPDGSIFVSDWYDPGVGGHAMGDLEHGRIYRIAPKGVAYNVPRLDYSTVDGAVQALKNPSFSVRYLAWTSLHGKGLGAEAGLQKLFGHRNPRLRARALWLLGKIEGRGQHYVDLATSDADSDIRIVGLRLARQLDLDVLQVVRKLVDDPSPQVRRECAIALHRSDKSDAPKLWARLANHYDGKDRWYLEALGIGAHENWDACLAAWIESNHGKWNTPAGRDIVWRSRAKKTPDYLIQIVADRSTPMEELPRFLRAFDFQSGPDRYKSLVELGFNTPGDLDERETLIAFEAIQRLEPGDISKAPERLEVLERVIERTRGTGKFIDLIEKFDVESRYPDLLDTALANAEGTEALRAMKILVKKGQLPLIKDSLASTDSDVALKTARALETTRSEETVGILLAAVDNESQPLEVRAAAVRAAGRMRPGAEQLLQKVKTGELDADLKPAAGAILSRGYWKDLAEEVSKLFPLAAARDNRPLPPIRRLFRMSGDAERGKKLFFSTATCGNCHVVGSEGKEVGPNLSEIGSKLSRYALFDSILFPNAGISHNYETWAVALKSGQVTTGILLSDTAETLTIKDAEAIERKFAKSDIASHKQQKVSLMPADLQKTMTEQELLDVVAYLEELKRAQGK